METIWKQQSSDEGPENIEDAAQSTADSPFHSQIPNQLNVGSGDSAIDNSNARSEDSEDSNIDDQSHTPSMHVGLIPFIISGLIVCSFLDPLVLH